jgi:hypothetical protein
MEPILAGFACGVLIVSAVKAANLIAPVRRVRSADEAYVRELLRPEEQPLPDVGRIAWEREWQRIAVALERDGCESIAREGREYRRPMERKVGR